MKTKILLGVCGLVLVGGASVALAQRGERRGDDFGGRRARIGRLLQRVHQAREGRGDVGHKLGITDDQKALARSIAQQLRPVAETIRPQLQALAQRARELARSGDREGARALLKSELKPLIESARAQARPLVQPLIASLTAEQRAKLEAAAKAHGRTLDEGKLADHIALRLARLGRRTERR